MKDLLWLIPALPFLGVLANGILLRNRVSKTVVSWIACGAVGLSCLLAIFAIGGYLASPEHAAQEPWKQTLYTWMPAGDLTLEGPSGGTVASFDVTMAFQLDPLSVVMLFVVTFVGFLIHVYSVGYMAHEEGYQRYFTYLNLFMGAMLLLVLGSNYAVMFVGWEGVGLCSYLLIGFYFKEEFPPYAGRKAFLVNRIGDFAFVVGLFALISRFGTLEFSELFETIRAEPGLVTGDYVLGMSFVGFVTLCLFIGATGKSAQIPLYVWLPDAMAGPTPVSALIHAATMVTAGVYMVARSNVLYQLAEGTSLLVATVGALTAIFAATIGLAQTDIKKVLAYSTVSQLGYMFLAAGLGAYWVAIFHVGTHAFFKALLFLGSGSVIHAMSGEQDMRSMGSLKKHLPITWWTFLIATLAIAGIPPLAGFFSKDAILATAFAEHKYLLWALGFATAGLTAFYMFRAVFMTFTGSFRGTEEQHHHLHESPPSMTVPLIVLAVGSVLVGLVGPPPVFPWKNSFEHFLAPVMAPVAGEHGGHHMAHLTEWLLIIASVLVAVIGIGIAWRIYGGGRGLTVAEGLAARFRTAHRVLVNKYYVDELYDATVVRGFWATARGLFRFDAAVIDGFLVNGTRHLTVAVSMLSGFFDKYFVDGAVNAVAWVLQRFSRFFRRLQTGLVSQYAFVLVVGVLAFVCVYLLLSVR